VYLDQDDGILPPSPRQANATEYQKYFGSHSQRFDRKEKTNLKYFTSNISDLPGPITSQMNKMHDERRNSTVNKRFDNNLRKLLYHSSYKIVSQVLLKIRTEARIK
jgi:hypothetical protein